MKPLSSYANLSIAPGDTVTYGVSVTNVSSISGFVLEVQYFPTSEVPVVMGSPTLDYSGNIFGTNLFVSDECIDGQPVAPGNNCGFPGNGPGVITLGLINLSGNITAPVKGSLFKFTLTVLTRGFTNLHILTAFFVNGALPTGSQQVPTNTIDSYFSDIACPSTSTIVCKPSVANFSFSPVRPLIGRPTQFNASASRSQNQKGNITSYFWDLGDSSVIVTNPVLAHQYFIPLTYTVTLAVTDSYGITGFKSIQLRVIRVWLDLAIYSLTIRPFSTAVTPGTLLTITATVVNFSTRAENASLEISFNNRTEGTAEFFNLQDGGGQSSKSITIDTTQLSPRVYIVSAFVDPVRNSTTGQILENDTSNDSSSQYLQLIEPLPSGFGIILGLGILPSFAIGLALVAGIVIAAGLFRRKPSVLGES